MEVGECDICGSYVYVDEGTEVHNGDFICRQCQIDEERDNDSK